MSCSLPPELLDLIIDHLRNEPAVLKTCCVVSKSWPPRTRKHLFAHVKFHIQKSHIELWKKTFPNPSNSPACYTHSLSICGLLTVTAADVGWIHTFHRLVKLELDTYDYNGCQVSLVPLRGLSPTLKSLTLIYYSVPSSEVFGLVCSFPLLEELALVSCGDGSYTDGWDAPSTSPKLTGPLTLRSVKGIRSVVRQLCDLPDGLRFNRITVGCLNEDIESAMDLVSRCFDTLESISVAFYLARASAPASVFDLYLNHYVPMDIGSSRIPSPDLSKATKLKDVEFCCTKSDIQWVTTTLQTIESENLQQITIDLYPALVSPVGETFHQELLDLDRVLVQFSTSHSIRPKITHVQEEGGSHMRNTALILFPELARRDVMDVVEHGL